MKASFWKGTFRLLTLLLCTLTASSWAEFVTVTLKNGQVVQGEVTAENDQEITMDAAANKSGTIVNSRTLRKTDIQNILRETPEETAQRQLELDYGNTQKYQLTNASSPWGYYDQIIKGVFRNFLSKHPSSPYSDEVTQKIAAWTAERDRVATGATKRGGQWFEAASSNTVSRMHGTNSVSTPQATAVASQTPTVPAPALITTNDPPHVSEAAVAPVQPQPPQSTGSWFKTYWIGLALVAIVLIYIVCRYLEH